MEPMTAFVFAFQLLALFSIAGALLIYLICKVRDDNDANLANIKGGTVLVTSADTALGLQLCTYLANKGCRVFAGMRDTRDSLPAKLINAWLKQREFDNDERPQPGTIILLRLDVTREDIMRDATVALGTHLNADEHGITAIIYTSGSYYRGRFDTQEVLQWDHMFKNNILGTLRVAKTFLGFLRYTRGRLIYLGAGAGEGNDGLVAFNATRVAVEKCAEELRKELQPFGVFVVALDTCGVPAEALYKAPEPYTVSNVEGTPTQYTADVLSASSLQVIERALWDSAPQERYHLTVPNSKLNFMLPCRSSLRCNRSMNGSIQRV